MNPSPSERSSKANPRRAQLQELAHEALPALVSLAKGLGTTCSCPAYSWIPPDCDSLSCTPGPLLVRKSSLSGCKQVEGQLCLLLADATAHSHLGGGPVTLWDVLAGVFTTKDKKVLPVSKVHPIPAPGSGKDKGVSLPVHVYKRGQT